METSKVEKSAGRLCCLRYGIHCIQHRSWADTLPAVARPGIVKEKLASAFQEIDLNIHL